MRLRAISYRLDRAVWWLKHRLLPWHRYHVVSTGLPPGWHDFDERILWTAFTMFRGVVEREKILNHWAYDTIEDKLVKQEITDLYSWWVYRRPLRASRDPLDLAEAAGLCKRPEHRWEPMPNGLFRWVDESSEEDRHVYHRYLRQSFDWEKACYQEDTDALVRLMKIRQHLWT